MSSRRLPAVACPCKVPIQISNSQDARPHSRGAMRPDFARNLRPIKQRAWGMPGAQCTRSRACSVVNTRVSHRRSPGNHPAFPHAVVLTGSFVLSPAIGLSCHRHPREPSSRELDAGVEASGPHDFAVRVGTVRQPVPPASTASRPASVTIAIRPSVGRNQIAIVLICPRRQE